MNSFILFTTLLSSRILEKAVILLDNKYTTFNHLHIDLVYFADCGSTTIANGVVTHTSVTTYGAQASISCDVGYNVTGTGIIECLDTGLWDQNSSCLIIGMIFFMVFNYVLVYVCKLRLHHFKDSPTLK